LSLHGASGLKGHDIVEAVARGIRKINFNTELRAAYFDATRERLPTLADGLQMLALNQAQSQATADAVASRLALLRPQAEPSRLS